MSRAAPIVYLARHGSPDLTRTDLVYHLPPGPPLTPAGELEAAALGRFLAARGIRGIWASPLERAWRTASIAGAICGLPLNIRPELIEIQPGETHVDVEARTSSTWQDVVAAAGERGPQAIVAHGGVVTARLLALGVEPSTIAAYGARFDSGNPLPPAGAWEIGVGERRRSPRLVFAP